MKFICVDCDEDLIVRKVDKRERGSVWLHMQCRRCGWQMALVASDREAETLRSLGIRFDEQGRTVYMELVKTASHDETDTAVEPLGEVSSRNSKHLTTTPQIGFFGHICHVLAGAKVRCKGLEIYLDFAETGSQKNRTPGVGGKLLKG